MSEFRKADNSVYQVFLELVEKTFPELSGYSFGLLFRQKIKKSRGRVILAEICLPSKLLSFFAKSGNGEPYDFLIITDEMIWACAKEVDRIALIRHEMRHVAIDKKGKARMVDHDFADFHIEVELNADRPMWASDLCEVAEAAYKQLKDGGQDPRVNRKDSPEATETITDKPRQTQVLLGPNTDSDKSPGKESKLTAGNGKKPEGQSKGPKVISSPSTPDRPVPDATEKLNALAKRRGLSVPAPASSI